MFLETIFIKITGLLHMINKTQYKLKAMDFKIMAEIYRGKKTANFWMIDREHK